MRAIKCGFGARPLLYASSAAHGRVFVGGGSGGGRRSVGGRLDGENGAGCVWLQCSMPHSGAYAAQMKLLDHSDARNCKHSNHIMIALRYVIPRVRASQLTRCSDLKPSQAEPVRIAAGAMYIRHAMLDGVLERSSTIAAKAGLAAGKSN